MVISGLSRWDAIGQLMARGWVIACALSTLIYWFHHKAYPVPLDEGTGWVLGRKYGHLPEKLLRIVGGAQQERQGSLCHGAAWGATSAMFDGHTAPDDACMAKFERFMYRWHQTRHPQLNTGVLRAFDTTVTPRLDRQFLPSVERSLKGQ
jgi:hypothetical protein